MKKFQAKANQKCRDSAVTVVKPVKTSDVDVNDSLAYVDDESDLAQDDD